MRWLLLLQSSRCAGFNSCHLRALEHRFQNCGAQATLWRVESSRDQTVSPALSGGFLTSGPPEKSSKHHFKLAQEVCEIPSISLSHFTDEDVKIQVKRFDS